ncbi:MAG TPA: hypothetical protein DDW52_03855, partial [Planctomycetaceae bacterium]|nr:hypothetical protein [Planctomycetaceae bacterium]
AGLGRQWEPPPGLLSDVSLKTIGQRKWSTGRMVNKEWGTVADVWWLAGSTSSIEITITQSGDNAAAEQWSELGWSEVEQAIPEDNSGSAVAESKDLDAEETTQSATGIDASAEQPNEGQVNKEQAGGEQADGEQGIALGQASAESSGAADGESDDSSAASDATTAEVLRQTGEVLVQLPDQIQAVRLQHDEFGYAFVLSSRIAAGGTIAPPAAEDDAAENEAAGTKVDGAGVLEVQLFSQSPTAHNPHIATQTINLFIELLNDVAETRGGERQLAALQQEQSKMLLPRIPVQQQQPPSDAPEALVPEVPTADPATPDSESAQQPSAARQPPDSAPRAPDPGANPDNGSS